MDDRTPLHVGSDGFVAPRRSSRSCLWIVVGVLAAAVVIAAVLVGLGLGLSSSDTQTSLASLVRSENILKRLYALTDVGTDGRSAYSQGYNLSAAHIAELLRDETKLNVTLVPVPYEVFRTVATPALYAKGPGGFELSFVHDTDFSQFLFTVAGYAEGQQVLSVGTGCVTADWSNFTAGAIAIALDNSSCDVAVVAELAIAANASIVLVHGQTEPDLPYLWLDDPADIAMLGVRPLVATALLSAPNGTRVWASLNVTRNTVVHPNVIATTLGGNQNSTIVIGAHLDTVDGTKGVNDNGSGAASLLEIAIQMCKSGKADKVANRVVFAWWAGEEEDFWGSRHYVASLSDEERNHIYGYLNLDMIGSPNWIRTVGNPLSLDDEDLHNVSSALKAALVEYMDGYSIPWESADIEPWSDHCSFSDAGIPVALIENGASDVKTVAQYELYGGLTNAAADPCYHKPCDNKANIGEKGLEESARAFAYALEKFAMEDGLSRQTATTKRSSRATKARVSHSRP